ncbi:Gamma-2-syntrophin [Geodia barretti]|uniref:Gamma-2-syntrophin n=1 Tax=Geodia barretti TaxID=519541 RepID=A0AA35W3L9_GEOBA|nr:Gamma-2-syntrophin [Geodia barretti]
MSQDKQYFPKLYSESKSSHLLESPVTPPPPSLSFVFPHSHTSSVLSGLKRVTLMKDPVKGIGCTIKSAAGHVLVNRIIEDGPIAQTGVLRPGDEILDIQGTTVTGMQVSEVVEVIKHVPDQFLATVRPLTSISKNQPVDTGSVLYSEIKPMSMAPPTSKPPPHIPEILISGDSTTRATSFDLSPTPSLEDVGYYDDEEEDTPPPIPPRTEDALVILDTPSQLDREEFKPALPPKPNTPPLSLSPARPPLPKSKSVEGIAGRHAYEEVDLKRSPRPRRHHDYEEIQPALNYMDINKLDFSKRSGGGARSKTNSLVKVEMDWKHKVHV